MDMKKKKRVWKGWLIISDEGFIAGIILDKQRKIFWGDRRRKGKFREVKIVEK